MKEKEILKAEHLQKNYRNQPVLRDVTFSLYRGHILGLIGKKRCRKDHTDEICSGTEYRL